MPTDKAIPAEPGKPVGGPGIVVTPTPESVKVEEDKKETK